MIAYHRAKVTFTDCYPYRDAACRGLASHPHGYRFAVKQEEIYPV
jgi:hypothetical protein